MVRGVDVEIVQIEEHPKPTIHTQQLHPEFDLRKFPPGKWKVVRNVFEEQWPLKPFSDEID